MNEGIVNDQHENDPYGNASPRAMAIACSSNPGTVKTEMPASLSSAEPLQVTKSAGSSTP